MSKLVFPEILEELRVPEHEFIGDAEKNKKRNLTDDEIIVEAMSLIETNMPRIHKLITLMWGHPKDFDPWIEGVWLDDRGGRQGFPPVIMSALNKLHTIHVKRFGTIPKKDDPWTANRKIL